MGESQESQVLRVKISAYRIPGLKEVAILKTLLGKWTQLEDVFPNENGDIPNVNGGYWLLTKLDDPPRQVQKLILFTCFSLVLWVGGYHSLQRSVRNCHTDIGDEENLASWLRQLGDASIIDKYNTYLYMPESSKYLVSNYLDVWTH